MKIQLISRFAKVPGQRPPLLFVHGACHGAWCWTEYFLQYFADAGFDAHALSLRGHGRYERFAEFEASEGSEGIERLRFTRTGDYLSDIQGVIEKLGTLDRNVKEVFIHTSGTLSDHACAKNRTAHGKVEPLGNQPILVGHSMGARLVQIYAARYGAAALILLAPPPPSGILPSAVRQLGKMFCPVILNHVCGTWTYLSKNPRYAKRAFFHPNLSDDLVANYVKKLGDEAALAYFQMWAPLCGGSRKVRCPVKVIGAARDQIFTRKEIEATARLLGVTAEVKDDMAHDIMLDPNWEIGAQVMKSWLESAVPHRPL